MLTRRTLLRAAAVAPAAAVLSTSLSTPARAAEPETFARDGIAIRGADPVAYFTRNEPVIGSADHALMWHGATWHFETAETLETFMANPDAYAPQYGGYCAFAMSRGYLAPIVPEAWSIVEGKLYLNYSIRVRRNWSEDIAGNIALADGYWPDILA